MLKNNFTLFKVNSSVIMQTTYCIKNIKISHLKVVWTVKVTIQSKQELYKQLIQSKHILINIRRHIRFQKLQTKNYNDNQ